MKEPMTNPIPSLEKTQAPVDSPWPEAGEIAAHWRYSGGPRRAEVSVSGRCLGNARQLMKATHDRY